MDCVGGRFSCSWLGGSAGPTHFSQVARLVTWMAHKLVSQALLSSRVEAQTTSQTSLASLGATALLVLPVHGMYRALASSALWHLCFVRTAFGVKGKVLFLE